MPLIQTREEFEHARTVLLDADVIALDTETMGLDGHIVGFSTYCKIKGREDFGISFYFPCRHEHDPILFSSSENIPEEWWKRDLSAVWGRTDVTWIFHNYKFDIQKFWQDDIDVKGPFQDTMIMSWMIDENSTHALKSLSVLLGDKEADVEQKSIKDIEKNLGGWHKVPPDVMALYAEKDTVLTYRLWEYFTPLIAAQELTDILPVEMQFSKVLAQMEYRGLRIDVERAQRLGKQARERMQAIQKTLGFEPSKKSQLARKLFEKQPEGLGFFPIHMSKLKLASPITLSDNRELRYIPVMDKGTLMNYSDPVIDLVLEYRGLEKAAATWFEGFVEKADLAGRMHPTFKHHGTVTSRLSCSNPNVQQIPHATEDERDAGISKAQVKSLFTPSDGFELWEFDYAQIEFRLAACYSKEEALIEGYRAGVDFHASTAQVLGIDRYDAKRINFAILYGGGGQRIADVMWADSKVKMTAQEGWEVIREWKAAFPKLAQTIAGAEQAASRGYIRYWDGRRRHFRFPSEHRLAFNSACQGGGARIMIRSMIDLQEKKPECPMTCQVHDAVWIELPVENLEKHKNEICELMEWPTQKFEIAFPVDAHPLNA